MKRCSHSCNSDLRVRFVKKVIMICEFLSSNKSMTM